MEISLDLRDLNTLINRAKSVSHVLVFLSCIPIPNSISIFISMPSSIQISIDLLISIPIISVFNLFIDLIFRSEIN